ncbi:MAG: RNA methyltransferase [Bacteroidales bacterium]
MNKALKRKLADHFRGFITDEREEKICNVLKYRTKHLAFVLENLYQPHNASAVLRSCEINGIQDIHVIENHNSFSPSKNVAMGSAKWLNIYKYNQYAHNTEDCISSLKRSGYRVVATTPHYKAASLPELALDKPLALIFGTELEGLSETALQHADSYLKIPMYGFTESYNISVSAAICAYHLMQKLRQSDIPWQLDEEQKLDLKIEWYRRSIKQSELLEKKFLDENSPGS